MGAFFETVINFFQAILAVLQNLVVGIAQMLLMVPRAVTFLTYTIGFVPSMLAVSITAIITVNVVYLIIGR